MTLRARIDAVGRAGEEVFEDQGIEHRGRMMTGDIQEGCDGFCRKPQVRHEKELVPEPESIEIERVGERDHGRYFVGMPCASESPAI